MMVFVMVSRPSIRFMQDETSYTESKVALRNKKLFFASFPKYSSSFPAFLCDRSKFERFRSQLIYKRGVRAWPDVSHSS